MRGVLHLADVFYPLDVGPFGGAGRASKRPASKGVTGEQIEKKPDLPAL